MKALNMIHTVRDHLKHVALASVAAISLGAGSAQALTTTVIDLGVYPAYTQIDPGTLYPRIAVDDLPSGSILRKVSWDVRLGNGDPYLGDLAVYFANRAGAGVLQVGAFGDNVDGGTLVAADAPIKLPWNAGNVYAIGTPASTTLTAVDGVPAIDLHDHSVSLETVYPGGWAGTITLEYDVPQPARILSFGPGAIVDEVVGNSAAISWTVPFGTNVTALSPTFTLSSGTCTKVSGGTYDFTNPVAYTVTDGATVNTYTVTVTVAPDETTLVWDANSGVWDFSTLNWKGQTSGVSTIFFNGKNVIFDKAPGGTVTLMSGIQPLTTTVNGSGNYSFSGAPLGGAGSLTKSGNGNLTITSVSNTYTGGTTINAGQLKMDVLANAALGTGPVNLNGGRLYLERITADNALIVNGGNLYAENGFGDNWNGPVTLNSNLIIAGPSYAKMTFNGSISGAGGLTLNGDGPVVLEVANSYTGPTSVTACTLECKDKDALGSGALSISSTANSKVNLNYSGTKNISSLTLGGVAQTVFGTYGSSASGASIQNNTYFAGTGTVTVSPIITSFGIPGYAGVINQAAKTIALTVPFGTSLATLAPTFTVTFGSCNQTSGSPPSPTFAAANPAHYIVTSGAFQNDYAVTVTVAPASTACDILTFGLPNNPGVIDQIAKTITLTVPVSPGVSSLAPTFTQSPFATSSPPSGTTRNFTNPQTYTVTAQNGTTTKTYTVTVQTYQSWNHSGSIFILTDATGANLPASASETNFPLLVRLNSSNFSFTQAAPDGSDIRFSSTAGTALPYEIEQWDSVNGKAAVWVKIPTITGNARQEIKMYWGKSGVASQSNGAAVFNSSNGYSCVMHLNGNVLDSTGSTSPVNDGATAAAALIGGTAMNLSTGDITAANITNFPAGTNPTSSGQVWVKARNITSWSMPLAWGNKNAYGWNTWQMQIGFWGSPSVLPSPLTCRGPAVLSGSTTLAADQWYHLAYTNSGGTAKLYVNGVLDGTASGGTLTITNPQALSLGMAGGDADVDEARVSSVARSADWVKMEYENQKPQQTLLGILVQSGSTFSASPPTVTMNEGTTTSLSGQADGAQKVYWNLVRNGVETVLATDQFTYSLSPGRITGDQSFVVRFKGIYPAGIQTVDIPVTVTDTIPDPVFTLSASTSLWDGRQTMTVTPVISNLAALQAAGVASLNYNWSVAGVAAAKTISSGTPSVPGVMTLTRAQGSGPMTVTLVLDNGGAAVSSSKTITVQEPASDAWVQRTPGANEKAVNNQFYARDPNTNLGTVFYNGTGAGTTPVYLKVFATPNAGTESQYGATLRQTPAGGAYGFSVPIAAGKVTYRVEFGTTTAGTDTPSAAVTNLVCGDAYIIEGQSNAVATDNSAPNDSTTDPWVRTYGRSGAGWGYANSKGSDMTIGFWGMALARSIVSDRQMPVCFINGAVGGTQIIQHQPNPANHTVAGASYSIYADLLNRVIGANLTHGIRGIFWHQGESDCSDFGSANAWDYTSYQENFVNMSSAWNQDYPNLQRYIIYQVMPAPCSIGPKGDQLREVQRNLPLLYSKMSILNTLGLAGYEGCHFSAAGYSNIANRMAPLVYQDFYGVVPAAPVTPPNLKRAYFTSGARTAIALEFDQAMSWSSFSLPNYFLDKVGGKVTSGSASGNLVTLQLSSAASATATLDYLEDTHWNPGESVSSLLYGANAIPALTFADVPIGTNSPYESWSSSKNLNGGDAAGDADPDQDGIRNSLEFVLGGEPNPSAPGSNSVALLPNSTRTGAGDLIFTFNRKSASIGVVNLAFEWSTDLTFPALNTLPIGEAGSTVNGIDVAISSYDAATHTIIITVPAAKAAGGRLFGRLHAEVP